MRLHCSVLCAASTAALLSASLLAQARATPQRPARSAISSEAVEGRRVFDAQCAWCHGNGGGGGMGPNLHRNPRHATTLASIVEVITNGIPTPDMPGVRSPPSD